MRIEQFQAVLEISKTKSMKKAAENLHSSAQNMSILVSNLEKELGVQLFIRNKYGVFLTPDGERICQQLEKIMLLIDDLIPLASNSKNNLSNPKLLKRFNILSAPSEVAMSSSLLKKLCKHYTVENSSIHIYDDTFINNYFTETINNFVQNFDLALTDMAHEEFMANKAYLKKLPCFFLSTSALGVHISKKNKLAQKSKISIAEIINEPLIIRVTNDDAMGYLLKYLVNLGVNIKPKYKVNSEKICKQFISDNMGYSLLQSNDFNNNEIPEDTVIIPLKEKISIVHLAIINPAIQGHPCYNTICNFLKKNYSNMYQIF